MKDLTEYLIPNLDIPYGGKVYSCQPPTQADGLILAAVVSAGVTMHGGNEIDADTQKVLDSVDSTSDLSRISLSAAAHDQMVADGVPGPHIARFGSYAMYYWVLGEETADAMFATMYGSPESRAPKAQKSGRSTASGSRTRTASTPGTKSRPATSDHKAPSPKAAASRGVRSSTTGA